MGVAGWTYAVKYTVCTRLNAVGLYRVRTGANDIPIPFRYHAMPKREA
jgi:hypothetical protein